MEVAWQTHRVHSAEPLVAALAGFHPASEIGALFEEQARQLGRGGALDVVSVCASFAVNTRLMDASGIEVSGAVRAVLGPGLRAATTLSHSKGTVLGAAALVALVLAGVFARQRGGGS